MDPDRELLPNILRHDDPPELLESILKLELAGNFDEKCLKNLRTYRMRPTMILIASSANLHLLSIGARR